MNDPETQSTQEGRTVLLHLGAVVYRQGKYFGFEILQNGKVITSSPPMFETQKEAKEASSKILSFAAEKMQEDLPIERMVRIQRDLPEEL